MRIAAIDYGLSCGLAITDFEKNEPNYIHLKKFRLQTIEDNIQEIYQILKDTSPDSVVLEACPYRAAGNSLRIYEHTHAMLTDQLDYRNGKDILAFNELVTIGPGLWKPFVNKQNLPYHLWNPKTKHEKDAMSLLWYALTISTEKEVKIV